MSDPNIAEKYYGKLKAAGYETEADFVFNQGIQIKQLIAKLGLISIAAEEGNLAKVKELIPPSCADVVREMRAEAVSNVKFDTRDAIAVLEQSGDGSFGSDDVEQMRFEMAFISDVILANKANQLRTPEQEKE